MMMMRQSVGGMEAQPPISPGELEVRAIVTMTSAIR
jgi:hypothetical protein